MVAANDMVNDGARFVGTQAVGALANVAIGVGIDAYLASRAAAPEVKVVINWAHRIMDVRPGHLPPPGTQEEIQAAVEAAIKAERYTTSPKGVIDGITDIHGIEVGFSGKLMGNEWRISTVFTKR
jgi:hypothetical protein